MCVKRSETREQACTNEVCKVGDVSQWRRQQGKGVWNGDEKGATKKGKKPKRGPERGPEKKSKKRVQREEGVPLKRLRMYPPQE